MSPTPTATPSIFDISPIPIFPWVPGIYSWLTLAFVILLILIFRTLLPRIKFKPKTEDALKRGLRELEFISTKGAISRDDIYASSLAVRRTLSVLAKNEESTRALTEMSAAEVRKLAEMTTIIEQRELLLALLKVEELKYAPTHSLLSNELITKLFTCFKSYAERIQRSKTG